MHIFIISSPTYSITVLYLLCINVSRVYMMRHLFEGICVTLSTQKFINTEQQSEHIQTSLYL